MQKKSARQADIIYQDDHIIAINKPAGLLSIPDRYIEHLPNCLSFLRKKFDNIFAVHRIDRETSGVMLFARDEASHKHLNEQFESRKIDKTYYAYVDGVPMNGSGTIDKKIAKSKKGGMMEVVPKLGKNAISHYSIKEDYKHFSKLAVKIETGRTHQIRVHLKSIGHPLMVDKLYGLRSEFLLSELKRRKYRLGKFEEERPFIQRQTLHAAEIGFSHPSTGKKMTINAPLPKDLKALEYQLNKWINKNNKNQ